MYKLPLRNLKKWKETYFCSQKGLLPTSILIICPNCQKDTIFFVTWDARKDSALGSSKCHHCDQKSSFWAVEYLYPTEATVIQNIEIYMRPKPMVNNASFQFLVKISPDGIQTLQQAEQADFEGLHLICGMAYRKAFEIIVKDYHISLQPENKQDIIKKSLYDCIKMFNSVEIKSFADSTRILGNDETHYEKRYEDYSLDDLKKLLYQTLKYIDYEVSAKAIVNDIQGKTNPNPK